MVQISSIKNTSFPVNGKWRTNNGYRNHIDGNPENEENNNSFASMFSYDQNKIGHEYDISCKWEPFREQILSQWPRLTQYEVDVAGPNRGYIAALISIKYRLDQRIISNYLINMERNLPLM